MGGRPGLALRALAAAFVLAMTGLSPAFAASPFPAYFKVDGVAADDQLNVRAAPDAASAILDTLAPAASPVEILETVTVDGRSWGRLALGEGNGWVAMRFLAPIELDLIDGTKVPAGLQCGGTEPFWGLRLGASALDYSAIDQEPRSFDLVAATSAAGRNHRFALIGRRDATRMTAFVSRGEQCSDGMSDTTYGWRIDLLMEEGEIRQLEGCCRMRR